MHFRLRMLDYNLTLHTSVIGLFWEFDLFGLEEWELSLGGIIPIMTLD